MKPGRCEEKELVENILKGEESSLRKFYDTYYRPILSFIRKRINSENDVEEVLQDTLLGALDSFRDFSFRCSIFTFLCSIASHKVIDYYRRKKIKNIVFSKIPDVEEILGTLLGPEEILDHEMLKSKIKKTLLSLSPMYQKIIDLKYIQGYTVSEIAEKLSLSFKSCESHLFRARKAFVVAFEKK
ncbi:hypothetical protein A3D77_01570 [Candidatus Gottesmanbacteria bacterium RIFCSPHIGHO2_02_FULL_39_11]|uniref:RNA polymerase sigma-70 ECF-like HTH domain-containing protein n=1 Tax=Candidatus Gottesmanbacteria bacterium RIFCSPHIGHO2_02_FULL_39_11 TaxID=1798382 RepID=A0A1F5ZTA2_9BACT|nr:MAG: hypothetical protein A3D77_01570 [Candidatus Gottesmanbacteria bacterium RIFCSPHIGHO2_02_FULL_39_11]